MVEARYYLKAVLQFLAVVGVTTLVIAGLATLIMLLPGAIWLGLLGLLMLVIFGSIIHDLANDIKDNEHWKKREKENRPLW